MSLIPQSLTAQNTASKVSPNSTTQGRLWQRKRNNWCARKETRKIRYNAILAVCNWKQTQRLVSMHNYYPPLATQQTYCILSLLNKMQAETYYLFVCHFSIALAAAAARAEHARKYLSIWRMRIAKIKSYDEPPFEWIRIIVNLTGLLNSLVGESTVLRSCVRHGSGRHWLPGRIWLSSLQL
jgi:hypothetical protein